ncbi:hypothetical protein D9M69_650070 [compost metagenome]
MKAAMASASKEASGRRSRSRSRSAAAGTCAGGVPGRGECMESVMVGTLLNLRCPDDKSPMIKEKVGYISFLYGL